MAEYFVGEIRMFPYAVGRVPVDFKLCDGSLMPIHGNEALFALIGVTYGGDGKTNFALPNLVCRVPVGQGQLTGGDAYPIGKTGGTETVALTAANLPSHTHPVYASTGAATASVPMTNFQFAKPDPSGNQFVQTNPPTTPAPTMVAFAPDAVGFSDGGAPHQNMMPSIYLQYYIAIRGLFPSRP